MASEPVLLAPAAAGVAFHRPARVFNVFFNGRQGEAGVAGQVARVTVVLATVKKIVLPGRPVLRSSLAARAEA
ncbi:hypothetical protein D0T11_04200 [Hymenobacter rubripertinctus]|uniref:Uncharacterized protein n=1 Tax=Hymenobacter rubripertinctus TaxID=2029981 RepID=A0A418R6A8_9BACT|nr:hypothetical protein D0T11_04200 [Hymenobacter rubripertinctus]